MVDLWNNIIYESSFIEKVIEYYEKKSKEKKENERKADLIEEEKLENKKK